MSLGALVHRASASAGARDERGSILVLSAVFLVALTAMAAYAVDTGIWFVHARHLQTQADAAALAGADVMAQGYLNGSCSDSSVKAEVSRYDGTLQSTPQYNQQVPVTPTYATTYNPWPAHNLFDQVNQTNFVNQSLPNDTGLTGHPCSDAAVDVKMTETNLPSFLTFVHPGYINRQAQVRAETVSAGGAAPFILPNIATPTHVAVFVVAEDPTTPAFSTDTILAKLGSCADGNSAPCLSSSNNAATWTTSGLSVAFTNSPASLVVAQSSSAIAPTMLSNVTTGASLVTFCNSTGVSCYDGSDGTGLTYTRTYTASSPNFPAAAPVIEDTSVTDAPSDPTPSCNSSGSTGLFTGFVASAGGTNGTCLVNFNANIDFGTETCAALGTGGNNLAATLTITATWSGGATSSTLTCPNPTGSATGNWTSSSTLSIPGNQGPVTFGLAWKRTGGGSATPVEPWETGGGNNKQCGSGGNVCQADFKIVQRIFTGAYDQNTASTSSSGPVAGAALTSGTGELMATLANQTVSGLGVTIDFQALYDTPASANGHVPGGSFFDIAYGGNQGNGLANCGQGVSNNPGPNGFDVQENAIAGLFTCTNYPVEPPSFLASQCTSVVCPSEVPGNKFLQWLDGGLAARIYGCPEASHSTQQNQQNGCSSNPLDPASCAAHPNYWSTQNLLSAVEMNTGDPRLLIVMITDPGTLAPGNHLTPVRHYAAFYVTGWTSDPCSGVALSGNNNGLHYVSEDTAPTASGIFFLLGHFIKYFQSGATGSGQTCVLNSIDNCVLVLTK